MSTLTDKMCRTAAVAAGKKFRKLYDGEGLYLLIDTKGSKGWRFKYRLHGREKGLSFGPYPSVSLASAREKRDAARDRLAKGGDPAELRAQAKADEKVAETPFSVVAQTWFDKMVEGKVRGKAYQREERHIRYFNAAFGNKPTCIVTHHDIIAVLERYDEDGKHETRSRMQSTITRIMGFAEARGIIAHSPVGKIKFAAAFSPVREKPRPSIVDGVAADDVDSLDARIGHLMRDIDAYAARGYVRDALKLMTLCFPRPGDVAAARWHHINLKRALWVIPFEEAKMAGERMASGKPQEPYRIPLSRQAVALLVRMEKLTGNNDYVFPAREADVPHIATDSLRQALIDMGYGAGSKKGHHVPHGFRSMASTRMNAERDGDLKRFDKTIIDLQLDHIDKGTTHHLYNRDQAMGARRTLMQWWGDHLDHVMRGDNVIPLKRKRA